MENFKDKLSQKFLKELTDKHLGQYEDLMNSLSDINSENAPGMPISNIKDIKVIKAILEYTNIIVQKTDEKIMESYSNSILSMNDSYSEEKVLETTDTQLEYNKHFFKKGVLKCYETLMKKFGNSCSDHSIRNSIKVNCAAKLKISSEKFSTVVKDWMAKIENTNKETKKETGITKAQ